MTIPPLVREIYRDIGIGALLIKAVVVDGEEFIERIGRILGFTEFIQRKGERRKHMDILELPQFIKDVTQFAADVQAARTLLEPQFPQLLADADKIKTDGEKLLGISAS